MKFYKYRSLSNLWHTLDIVLNRRLYCANWWELNDPLEGRYEIFLGNKSPKVHSSVVKQIEQARKNLRVASLSATATNFLLWSHYADGHKGVAIELDIPDSHPDLTEVVYSKFSSVFSDKIDSDDDLRHLFNGKGPEWQYEQEYRVITGEKFFPLPIKPSRLLLGPMIDANHRTLLKKSLSDHIEIVDMGLDITQGKILEVTENYSKLP